MDQVEFGKQYERLITKLKSKAQVLTNHNKQDTEDLLQDTIIKAYVNIESWDSTKGVLDVWMTTIMRNVFIDSKRTINSKGRKETVKLDTVFNVEDNSNSDEQILEKIELQEALRYIDLLKKKKYRDIMQDVILGLTIDDLAKKYKSHPITIRTTIHRIRKLLRIMRLSESRVRRANIFAYKKSRLILKRL